MSKEMGTDTIILEGRAEKLAQRGSEADARDSAGQYVLVSIAGHKIGLPVDRLREVVRAPPISELPNLPDWLPGIVHVRGELLGLVDLTRLYRWPELESGELIAVLRGRRGDLGVLVDRVLGFREVFRDEVTRGPADPAAGTGIPTAGTTSDLVFLFEPSGLFEDDRVAVEGKT